MSLHTVTEVLEIKWDYGDGYSPEQYGLQHPCTSDLDFRSFEQELAIKLSHSLGSLKLVISI